jgi:hypothetical protein
MDPCSISHLRVLVLVLMLVPVCLRSLLNALVPLRLYSL